MENSRVNLTALAVALVAGLVVLHEPLSILSTVAGLALLIMLLAFGSEGGRSSLQSLGYAFALGLAIVDALSYPIKATLGGYAALGQQDIIPPLLWLAATAIFWFVDQARGNSGQVQSVTTIGTATRVAPVPIYKPAAPTPTPAPVITMPPPASEPEPLVAPVVAAMPPPPSPPAPTPIGLPVAAPPVQQPSGKPASIYVNMVGEGMNVLRSVRAEHLGRDFYIIVDEMPADETWEFVPGQVVRCKKKNLSNGKGLVAFEEAPRAQV